MEKLIKSLKPQKMKKDELAKWIYENQADIVAFYVKKGFYKRSQPVIESLYNKMMSEKFPKALQKIIKRGKKEPDSGIYLDPGFVVIINGFLEYVNKLENKIDYDDVCNAYYEIIDILLKKSANKLAKKLDLDVELIKELLVIAPSAEYIKDDKSVGFASQKMLRKLYVLAKDKNLGIAEITTSQIKNFFKRVFGAKLLDLIAINVLLEKKEYIKGYNENQLFIWNRMTDFALETIEKQDKKHIAELLKYYAERRRSDDRNKRDSARRIVLTTIPDDIYPKIHKVVNKMDGKYTKYL